MFKQNALKGKSVPYETVEGNTSLIFALEIPSGKHDDKEIHQQGSEHQQQKGDLMQWLRSGGIGITQYPWL